MVYDVNILKIDVFRPFMSDLIHRNVLQKRVDVE